MRGVGEMESECLAAAQIPMMRELKVAQPVAAYQQDDGCSPNPYDEGTERVTNHAHIVRFAKPLQPKSL